MTNPRRPVVITGIGLLSAAGEGVDAHRAALAAGKPLGLDSEAFAPYAVHTLAEPDWSTQISRRDMRQMEPWQRIGTYTAGLALDDANAKDAELLDRMDMIVAAGGGERDVEVDTNVMTEARGRSDKDAVLNERLPDDLRPTLFLAQLSNLLAGNISIVHKVTGSSRTFMGEEGAGISAIATAHARISSGQSDIILVGGGYNAEREDMMLLFELGHLLSHSDGSTPVEHRSGDTSGVHFGSLGAFLVLESSDHAEARGARIYAELAGVEGAHGPRDGDGLTRRLGETLEHVGMPAEAHVLSGATGIADARDAEMASLGNRNATYFGSVFGHGLEAQFPFGVALAAIAHDGDATGITGVGAWRSEGAALVRPYSRDAA